MTNHFAEHRPPSMTQKSSSESLVSLDSFVHLIACSTESHTNPSDYMRETQSSSWRQGIRSPAESLASQYRNPNIQPFIFTYEPLASVKKADKPPVYNAPPSFAPSTRTSAFTKPSESINIRPVRQAPYFPPNPRTSRTESGSTFYLLLFYLIFLSVPHLLFFVVPGQHRTIFLRRLLFARNPSPLHHRPLHTLFHFNPSASASEVNGSTRYP